VARQHGRRAARRLKTRERRRTQYHGRRARQQCADCPRPAADGRTRCDEHLRAARERSIRSLDRRRVPTCRRCQLPFKADERQHGRRYHSDCHAQQEKERRAKPEFRVAAARRVRAWQRRHKEMGLCVRCSNRAIAGQVLCERHAGRRLSLERSS
jgi:hypothetical protein